MTRIFEADELTDDARLQSEVKAHLEDWRSVTQEIGAGTFDGTFETQVIDDGGLPSPPATQFVVVAGEGGSADLLVTIPTTNLSSGRIIYLTNRTAGAFREDVGAVLTGATVGVVNSGLTDGIRLADGGVFYLAGERVITLVLMDGEGSSSYWQEIGRHFGPSAASGDVFVKARADERYFLGVGDAGTKTIATVSGTGVVGKVLRGASSANIATGNLLAIDASGEIVDGGDPDELGGAGSPEGAVLLDAGESQTIADDLRNDESFSVANASSAGTAPVNYMLGAGPTTRGKTYVDGGAGAGAITMRNFNGATAQAGIRVNEVSAHGGTVEPAVEWNTQAGDWAPMGYTKVVTWVSQENFIYDDDEIGEGDGDAANGMNVVGCYIGGGWPVGSLVKVELSTTTVQYLDNEEASGIGSLIRCWETADGEGNDVITREDAVATTTGSNPSQGWKIIHQWQPWHQGTGVASHALNQGVNDVTGEDASSGIISALHLVAWTQIYDAGVHGYRFESTRYTNSGSGAVLQGFGTGPDGSTRLGFSDSFWQLDPWTQMSVTVMPGMKTDFVTTQNLDGTPV